MAAPKFLRLLLGRPTEQIAAAVGGSGSAEQVVSTNGAGLIDQSFFPAGIGQDIVTAPATEALAAGDLVNLYLVSTVESCRKADASSAGKECNGFVLASVASGAVATIWRSGPNTAVSAQVPGEAFLSTTPGRMQATPPTGTGQAVQKVGKIISATMADIQPGQDFILA